VFPTVEVRWFLPGRIPSEVAGWFERAGGEAWPAEERTDHYLRLGGEHALGIKVREGLLEIKRRMGSGEVAELHPDVAGQVERWRKWSFSLAAQDASLAHLRAPPGAWINVDKARLLARYCVSGARAVGRIPHTECPELACDWELTQVQTEGKAWWTVAFEAFGQESHLEQTLHKVVAHVLAAGAPPVLGAEDSYGYPEWLAMLDYE
jgi:hypothetical protein